MMKKHILFTLLLGFSFTIHADDLHNLIITVKNNNQGSSTDSNSSFSGGIRQGKITVSTGQAVPTQQDGITVRSKGLAYSSNTTTRTVTTHADQYIRTLEGSPAFIYTGESRLLSSPQDRYGNTHSTEVTANQGFYVNARLVGDRVLLDVYVTNDSFDQAPANSPQATMSTQRLSTTVSGQLGEWIALGGITLSDENQEKSLVKKTTAQSHSLGDISIKITSASP